jgi:hypothetical protein
MRRKVLEFQDGFSEYSPESRMGPRDEGAEVL